MKVDRNKFTQAVNNLLKTPATPRSQIQTGHTKLGKVIPDPKPDPEQDRQ